MRNFFEYLKDINVNYKNIINIHCHRFPNHYLHFHILCQEFAVIPGCVPYICLIHICLLVGTYCCRIEQFSPPCPLPLFVHIICTHKVSNSVCKRQLYCEREAFPPPFLSHPWFMQFCSLNVNFYLLYVVYVSHDVMRLHVTVERRRKPSAEYCGT